MHGPWRSLYPFESRELEVGGLRYHYVDEGQGDVLLLVHGNPTWSFYWRNLIGPLARKYRVIAVDHIGCGLSDKPRHYPYRLSQHVDNLAQFVERLDLSASRSWPRLGRGDRAGRGPREPERFARFVMFNTAAFRSQSMPWRIRACRMPLVGRLAVQGFNAFARAALRMAVGRHERMTPEVRAGLWLPTIHGTIARRSTASWPIFRCRRAIPATSCWPSSRACPCWPRTRGCSSGGCATGVLPARFSNGFWSSFRRPKSIAWPTPATVVEDAHERIVPLVERFLPATRSTRPHPRYSRPRPHAHHDRRRPAQQLHDRPVRGLATIMEATAPKPGNVHRGADFEDASYPDFVVAATVIGRSSTTPSSARWARRFWPPCKPRAGGRHEHQPGHDPAVGAVGESAARRRSARAWPTCCGAPRSTMPATSTRRSALPTPAAWGASNRPTSPRTRRWTWSRRCSWPRTATWLPGSTPKTLPRCSTWSCPAVVGAGRRIAAVAGRRPRAPAADARVSRQPDRAAPRHRRGRTGGRAGWPRAGRRRAQSEEYQCELADLDFWLRSDGHPQSRHDRRPDGRRFVRRVARWHNQATAAAGAVVRREGKEPFVAFLLCVPLHPVRLNSS